MVYPFYIHNYKSRVIDELNDAIEALKDLKSFDLAMFSWGDNWYFPNYLLTHGWAYRRTNDDNIAGLSYSFHKGERVIRAFQEGEIDHFDFEAMEKRINKWKNSSIPLVMVVNEEKILYIAHELCRRGEIKQLSKICFIAQ